MEPIVNTLTLRPLNLSSDNNSTAHKSTTLPFSPQANSPSTLSLEDKKVEVLKGDSSSLEQLSLLVFSLLIPHLNMKDILRFRLCSVKVDALIGKIPGIIRHRIRYRRNHKNSFRQFMIDFIETCFLSRSQSSQEVITTALRSFFDLSNSAIQSAFFVQLAVELEAKENISLLNCLKDIFKKLTNSPTKLSLNTYLLQKPSSEKSFKTVQEVDAECSQLESKIKRVLSIYFETLVSLKTLSSLRLQFTASPVSYTACSILFLGNNLRKILRAIPTITRLKMSCEYNLCCGSLYTQERLGLSPLPLMLLRGVYFFWLEALKNSNTLQTLSMELPLIHRCVLEHGYDPEDPPSPFSALKNTSITHLVLKDCSDQHGDYMGDLFEDFEKEYLTMTNSKVDQEKKLARTKLIDNLCTHFQYLEWIAKELKACPQLRILTIKFDLNLFGDAVALNPINQKLQEILLQLPCHYTNEREKALSLQDDVKALLNLLKETPYPYPFETYRSYGEAFWVICKALFLKQGLTFPLFIQHQKVTGNGWSRPTEISFDLNRLKDSRYPLDNFLAFFIEYILDTKK